MIKKFYKIIKNLVVEVTDFGTLTVINARFLAGCIFCHNWSKFLQSHKCCSDSRIYRSKSSKMTLFRGYVDREYLWQLHTVLTLFFYEMFKICIKISLNFTLPFCDWIFKKLHRNALFLRVLNKICVQKVCKNRAKIATCDENDSDSLGLSLTQHVFFAKWMVLMSKITKICTKFAEKWYPPSRRQWPSSKSWFFSSKFVKKSWKVFPYLQKLKSLRKTIWFGDFLSFLALLTTSWNSLKQLWSLLDDFFWSILW